MAAFPSKNEETFKFANEIRIVIVKLQHFKIVNVRLNCRSVSGKKTMAWLDGDFQRQRCSLRNLIGFVCLVLFAVTVVDSQLAGKFLACIKLIILEQNLHFQLKLAQIYKQNLF